MRIEGKVALITGASRGIGEACARAFLGAGASVAAAARSGAAMAGLEAAGAFAVCADLTAESARAMVVERTLGRFGRIDILVNNAGVGLYTPAWRARMPLVREMFELNFFAALDLITLVTPGMIERGGGAIVNVSSIAGKVTLPWLTAYSASKAALSGLGDGLRIELAPHSIHVMTVYPGYVNTSFGRSGLDGAAPEGLARYRRFAIEPDECAADILSGLRRNARSIMTPRVTRALEAARAIAPGRVDARLARIREAVSQDVQQ